MIQCPTIDEIRKIDVVATDMIQVEDSHQWTDINGFPHLDPGVWKTRYYASFFGTDTLWEISFEAIRAFSDTEALLKARQQLSRMTVVKGPYSGGYAQVYYYCAYENPEHMESALATTRD